MRLTQLLFRRQGLPRRMFSGKNRIPRIVTCKHKRDVLSTLAREEENLFYLRQPYITQAQEELYITNHVLPREAAEEYVVRRTIHESVSVIERLRHLKVTTKWD